MIWVQIWATTFACGDFNTIGICNAETKSVAQSNK